MPVPRAAPPRSDEAKPRADADVGQMVRVDQHPADGHEYCGNKPEKRRRLSAKGQRREEAKCRRGVTTRERAELVFPEQPLAFVAQSIPTGLD